VKKKKQNEKRLVFSVRTNTDMKTEGGLRSSWGKPVAFSKLKYPCDVCIFSSLSNFLPRHPITYQTALNELSHMIHCALLREISCLFNLFLIVYISILPITSYCVTSNDKIIK